MGHRSRFRHWLSAFVLGGTAFLLTSLPAAAQCILCYSSAAGAGGRGIRALQIGILVLLVPTLTFMAGLLWIAYRRRNSDAAGTEGVGKDSNWEQGLTTLAVSPEADGSSSRL